ncbi:MAG: hypothetical protein AB7E39_08205 [Endomicrobiaceae bacterium]
MSTISTETYKRGCFGQIIKWIFIFFNIFMIIWLILAFVSIGEVTATSDAEKVGVVIGGVVGTGIIIFIWCLGDIILGLLTFLTRGNKIIITKNIEEKSTKESL